MKKRLLALLLAALTALSLTACGAEDPDYQPEQPTQPENPGVKTGDESYVVPWSAALLLGGAALVLLPRKKRS